MGYRTAQQIVSQASSLLGLGAQATPFTAADANVQQLCAILASAGEDIVREHEWAHLRLQYTFATVPNQDTYSLPASFNRFVNQTQWNKTSRLPLGGPVTPQGWQLLKTLNVVAAVQMFFRTEGANIILHPVPSGIFTIALEYVSGYWVDTNGDGVGESGTPTADANTLLLDSQMLVHRLRRDFQEAKGFDSTASSEAYEKALALAKGSTEASPVLNLNHSPYNRARLLDGSNVPPTGFGS
jgi:hypothetical protein